MRAEHLHVTLAFIGRVASTTLGVLARLGASIAWPRTMVRLDRLEHWPRARALVLAATEPALPLMAARATLCEALASHGVAFDPAPFRAHVTLARGVTGGAPPASVQAVDWPLTRVALVESSPAAGGSDYRLLASWDAMAPDAGFQAI